MRHTLEGHKREGEVRVILLDNVGRFFYEERR